MAVTFGCKAVKVYGKVVRHYVKKIAKNIPFLLPKIVSKRNKLKGGISVCFAEI
jgi:hypothetical protein